MMDPWNSLEIARLSVSLLTPIVVITMGFLFNRRIRNFERGLWTGQKIVEKRLEIYDKLVPYLNDILCFHCYIGNWKEISPREVQQHKRVLDKNMSIYKPLFAIEVWTAYNRFIHLCFETPADWGSDATIRSSYAKRAEHCREWDEQWYDLFAERFLDRASSEEGYETLQNELKMSSYADLMETLRDSVELFKHESIRAIRIPRRESKG